MKLKGEPKKLAKLIIKAIKHKFEYELNSHVYMAAAILKLINFKLGLVVLFQKITLQKVLKAKKNVPLDFFLLIRNKTSKIQVSKYKIMNSLIVQL
jgi:hypothetical protein